MGLKIKYFFANKYWFKAHGIPVKGFALWSRPHILWLVAILAFIVVMCFAYKRKSKNERKSTRKFFAVAILVSELVKDTTLIIFDAPMVKYLPIHLCGLAIFALLIDAFCEKQELTGQMLAYAFMPGALCAELFCNWTDNNLWNFMVVFSFIFHAWIIAYMWMRYMNGEIRPNYSGIWKTFLMLAVISVPIFFLNRYLGTNYMFLNEASPGSPLVLLWDIFGTRFGGIGYLAAYAVLALLVFHVLYFLYSFTIKIVIRKNR